jgi:hypothetical protein
VLADLEHEELEAAHDVSLSSEQDVKKISARSRRSR